MRSTRMALVVAFVGLAAVSCVTGPAPAFAESTAAVEKNPITVKPVDAAPAVSIDSVLVVAQADSFALVLRGELVAAQAVTAATSADSLERPFVISIEYPALRQRLTHVRPVENSPMITGRYRSSARGDSTSTRSNPLRLNRRTS